MKQNFFSIDQESAQTSSELVITSSNFFISEDNKNGYFQKPQFGPYGEAMTPKERYEFSGFLNELGKGTKMNGSFITKRDKGGKVYGYVPFFYARGIRAYKVIMTEGIKRLIDDYLEGKIRVAVTAQELAHIAMND